MPQAQLPQPDRVPQTELLIVDTTPTVVTSDFTTNFLDSEFMAFVPAPPLSTEGLWLLGGIVLRTSGLRSPVFPNPSEDFFKITMGAGADEHLIGHDFYLYADCDDREYVVEDAYPQSAIANNFIQLQPGEPNYDQFPDGHIVIFVRWQGGRVPVLCGVEPLVQVELQYDLVTQTQTVEPRDLQLWGEDLCQNVVFAPTLPLLGHNRMVGFMDDDGVPIPGRHRLPEGFCELLTTHDTRMIEEEGSASAEVCKPSFASMVVAPDGFAKGYFCSKPEVLAPRRFQQNHFAMPFVQVGENDTTDPAPLQRDFSVSQQVPQGFCGFIGAYHAPRWTELLYYSRREICRGIL